MSRLAIPGERRSEHIVRSSGPGERAAASAALASEVECAHDVEGVCGGDGRLGLAEENVADVGVEIAVVRVSWRNAALGGFTVCAHKSKRAGIFVELRGAWRFFPRDAAGAKLGFLNVEGVLYICAERAVQHEAGTSGR